MARDVSTPVAISQAAAERLASGDLRPDLDVRVGGNEPHGDLARSFDGMVAALRNDALCRVASSADGLEAAPPERARTRRYGRTLSVSAKDRTGSTGHAARAPRAWSRSTRSVGNRAVELGAETRAIEESSSRYLELGASGEELTNSARACSRRRWTRFGARSSRWSAR